MTKILYIHHTSKVATGTSQFLLRLIPYLSPSYELEVVLDEDEGELPAVLRRKDITCHTLPKRTLLYLPSLTQLVINRAPDIIYGGNFSGRAENALWVAKLTCRPFIWHIHESLTGRRAQIRSLSLADAIIANSSNTAERITQYTAVREVSVVPCGVELADFNVQRDSARKRLHRLIDMPDEGIILLNVGRVCCDKNQRDAVEATVLVIKRYPQTILLVIGVLQDSEYVLALKRRVSELGLEDRVRFLGSQTEIPAFMRGADVLIHTARKESQGLVIAEAMAAQLPVIAYDVGGVSSLLVNGETGFLVPFGDISGLVKDIEWLISDSDLRHRMGQRGFWRVQRSFTAEETAQEITQVIDRILQQKRAPFPSVLDLYQVLRSSLSDAVSRGGSSRP